MLGNMRIFFLFFLFAGSSLTWAAGRCGFPALAEQHQRAKSGAARLLARQGDCPAEALYDSVYVDTTAHFRILYTLEGPHAPAGAHSGMVDTPPFIDTLAHWLEQAWNLHTKTIGMKTPQGPAQTLHYQDSRFPEKYPVEIIDIGLLRNTWDLLGGPCGACYGITLPAVGDRSQSELILDNDFLYQESSDPLTTLPTTTGTCTYSKSEHPITTSQNGRYIDYSEEWNIALRVTAFHELYHACQLRYQDYEEQYHFWFEASATGIEDFGAPEINDYIQYLDILFNRPQVSLFDVNRDQGMRPYGQAIFFHYLVHRFGLQFDPLIWTSLGKQPQTSISRHFDQFAKGKGETDFAALHHDFARHLLLAGTHADGLPEDSLWTADLPAWPTLIPLAFTPSSLPTDSFAFQIFQADAAARDYVPSDSSGLRKSLVTVGNSEYVLISSQENPRTDEETLTTVAPKAFPTPWRGNSDLCFQLSAKNSRISIYDAAGNPVVRFPHDTLSGKTCFDGRIHNKPLAPGLYFWRGSAESGLHRFLVVR